MKLPEAAFTVTDWASVPKTEHPGETGMATWQTVMVGEMRLRRVEYSAHYLADHWCDRGHVLLVIDGELLSELRDGRVSRMGAGMSYHVSDFGDAAHRSRSDGGATLFIID